MKQNKSRYALLGALTWGPQSGYDLRRNIEASLGNFWSEGYGQIYPLLKELVTEELVTKYVEHQESKPDRHVYTLTQAGKEALHDWLLERAEMPTARIEILLKLFFGRQVDISSNIAQLRYFEECQRSLFDKYEEIERGLLIAHKDDPDLLYWLITVRYGKHVTQALLMWSEETLHQLSALTENHP